MAQACLTKKIPYLGFGVKETHDVELAQYLIMWVKDKTGTEGHPLCKKGVAAAKAKATAEADKPKDMTPKDRQNNNKQKTLLNLRSMRGGQRQGQEEAPQATQQK